MAEVVLNEARSFRTIFRCVWDEFFPTDQYSV